jgi:PAS domain S-box-containing protein
MNSRSTGPTVLARQACENRSGTVRHYGICLGAVVAATLVSIVLNRVLDVRSPFLTYTLVIIGVALYCELVPTLLAIGLSLIASVVFTEPRLTLTAASVPDWISLALFLVVSIGVTLLARHARAGRIRAEQSAQAERDLSGRVRQSESRLQALVSSTSDVIWNMDANGAFVESQPAWAAFTGQSEDQYGGRGWMDALHPEDRPAVSARWNEAINSRAAFGVSGRIWHAAGEAYHRFEMQGTPVFEDGTVREWVGTLSDMHEREIVSAARRESEDQLRFALRAMPGGAWSLDLATRQLLWSPETFDLYGLDSKVAPSYESWMSAIIPDDRALVDRASQAALREPSGTQLIYRIQHPQRGLRWIESRGRLVRDESGRPVRLIGISLDITERRRAEQDREALLASERAARGEAERANQMKDEFLSMISHELRTPLNAILGWTQLLRRGSTEPSETEEALETIERNARAQTTIIDDLLDTSRIMSGKVRLQVESIDPAKVVQTAVQNHQAAAQAKSITVETHFDPKAGRMNADPNRVQQVVQNLVSNAVKFTPNGGHIDVSMTRIGDNLEIRIADTGEGIKPEFLPHVFERYRQADATTSRRFGGLGLGLATVKSLVELHHGSVQAVSEGQGMGSTFIVTLPIHALRVTADDGEFEKAKANSVPNDTRSLNGLRVLVVDDERDARELVRRLLREYEAEVTAAGSVDEALQVFDSFQPDVLIGDIGMPERDGFDLIRTIRARESKEGGQTPAIALTAFARAEDRIRTLRAGYQVHVSKPVEPTELLNVVASLAGRPPV